MSLPDYEEKEHYSAAEVAHIISREVMRHRLEDLEAKLVAHEVNATKMFAEIQTSLQKIEANVSRGTDQIRECRNDLRREIDKEFVTQLEATRMESEIHTRIAGLEAKVDRMWIKITATVTTALSLVGLLFNLLGWL